MESEKKAPWILSLIALLEFDSEEGPRIVNAVGEPELVACSELRHVAFPEVHRDGQFQLTTPVLLHVKNKQHVGAATFRQSHDPSTLRGSVMRCAVVASIHPLPQLLEHLSVVAESQWTCLDWHQDLMAWPQLAKCNIESASELFSSPLSTFRIHLPLLGRRVGVTLPHLTIAIANSTAPNSDCSANDEGDSDDSDHGALPRLPSRSRLFIPRSDSQLSMINDCITRPDLLIGSIASQAISPILISDASILGSVFELMICGESILVHSEDRTLAAQISLCLVCVYLAVLSLSYFL